MSEDEPAVHVGGVRPVVNVNPTVRRRRLGQELRRLRELKGMTAEEVADRLLVSQSKISRLENGRRSISQRDVRDLCGVYEVEDHRIVESLMQMAKDSRQQGWWHAFGDIPYSVYIGLETDAASLRVYEPQVLPGLLQTPAYAEAVVSGSLPEASSGDIEKRVRVRLRRQERIHDEEHPLRLWAVLDEATLRRVVGNRQIMREQLEYLLEVSRLPHVTVQVMPFDMGAHPGVNGQYAILEFPDAADSSVVYLEGITSDLYLEKMNDVQSYSMMYEHLRAQALSADLTRDFIERIAKEYTRSLNPLSPNP
ncbi:helix-turn-helix domain-containing protein [Streptomyces sp. TP-A0874]|uniref:helix-turn-helix domain-containing protein n=1 Tax=Streptomyces sp. TP-A0874 TaxID=549819 RepID=UPI001FCD6D43|nr:helix-turn-helix transcriptional regulator [Streptomyces sp. TP-A0874]